MSECEKKTKKSECGNVKTSEKSNCGNVKTTVKSNVGMSEQLKNSKMFCLKRKNTQGDGSVTTTV